MKKQKIKLRLFALSLALILGACTSNSTVDNGVIGGNGSGNYYNPFVDKTQYVVPSTLEDACAILNADDSWRQAFEETHRRYNVPPALIMAFIYQESSFRPHAKAPTSTAYGYAQALDGTWDWYKESTGKYDAQRSYMPDAIDFIGWYVMKNNIRTSVPKNNVEHQYLGYHEGSGGYLKGSHYKKGWLLDVAKKVHRRALDYQSHLNACYYNA